MRPAGASSASSPEAPSILHNRTRPDSFVAAAATTSSLMQAACQLRETARHADRPARPPPSNQFPVTAPRITSPRISHGSEATRSTLWCWCVDIDRGRCCTVRLPIGWSLEGSNCRTRHQHRIRDTLAGTSDTLAALTAILGLYLVLAERVREEVL
jgi:hypothetical protein